MAQGPGEVKNPLAGSTKAQWRAWARGRRDALDVAAASARLRIVVARWLAAQPPTIVVLYRAMAAELSLDALVAEDRRHRWATTRTPASGPLTVHRWEGPLETHRLGFVQPTADAAGVDDDEIGIVLAPGLVFDRAGGRIGYGKGYYDRLLAGLPRAVRVGVTVEALVVDALPTDAGDVAMGLLATEAGVRPVAAPLPGRER